jgi:hypothetical protein
MCVLVHSRLLHPAASLSLLVPRFALTRAHVASTPPIQLPRHRHQRKECRGGRAAQHDKQLPPPSPSVCSVSLCDSPFTHSLAD